MPYLDVVSNALLKRRDGQDAAIPRAGGDATVERAAVARYGRIDTVFNNAGIGQKFGVMTDDTPDGALTYGTSLINLRDAH